MRQRGLLPPLKIKHETPFAAEHSSDLLCAAANRVLALALAQVERRWHLANAWVLDTKNKTKQKSGDEHGKRTVYGLLASSA